MVLRDFFTDAIFDHLRYQAVQRLAEMAISRTMRELR